MTVVVERGLTEQRITPKTRIVRESDPAQAAQWLQNRGGTAAEIAELITFPQRVRATETRHLAVEPKPLPFVAQDHIQTAAENLRRQTVRFASALITHGLVGRDMRYADRLEEVFGDRSELPESLAERVVLEAYLRTREDLAQGHMDSWGTYTRIAETVHDGQHRQPDRHMTHLRETYGSVEERLALLSEPEMAAMRAVHVEELAHHEAAEQLGIRPGEVRAKLRSAQHKLIRESVTPLTPPEAKKKQKPTVDEERVDAVVRRVHSGDKGAKGELLALISPAIDRYVRSRVGLRETERVSHHDIAQEIKAAVLKGADTFRFQGPAFMAFVYGIASHKVVDAYRAAERSRTSAGDVPDTEGNGWSRINTPEEIVVDTRASPALARALNGLPPKQREIITLRVLHKLSAEETAEAVGSTPGAVRVAQHRALARMRNALAEEGITDSNLI